MNNYQAIPQVISVSGIGLLLAPITKLVLTTPASEEGYIPSIIMLGFIIIFTLVQTDFWHLVKTDSKFRLNYLVSHLIVLSTVVMAVNSLNIGLLIFVLYLRVGFMRVKRMKNVK